MFFADVRYTLTLCATVGVHSFMATQIGKLCVGLVTDFTLKRLDGGMNVRVLFQTTRRGKGLAAKVTGVTSCSLVMGTNMTLKIAGITKVTVTMVTVESSLSVGTTTGATTTSTARLSGNTILTFRFFRLTPIYNKM
jgi:hypothetical protein